MKKLIDLPESVLVLVKKRAHDRDISIKKCLEELVTLYADHECGTSVNIVEVGKNIKREDFIKEDITNDNYSQDTIF